LAILSRMTLAKANIVIHYPAILSRMSLVETNLTNTPDFIYIKHNIIVIVFIMKILNCISVKGRETMYLLHMSRDFLQQKIQSWSLLLNHKEVFGHDSFKPNVIGNSYSFIIHMILSIHVHFLIITCIYVLSIFLELVYQYASVRMTQFFFTSTKFRCPWLSFASTRFQYLWLSFASMKFQHLFSSRPFYMFLLNVDIYISRDFKELISTRIISMPKITRLLHTCKSVHQFTT